MADPLLSAVRISLLVLCMSSAARSDFQTLHVRDLHWIRWVIPATMILILEIASKNAGMSNICMTAALLAVFSFCFYTPPNPSKIREWRWMDALLASICILGIGGIIGGAITYSQTNFIDLVLGEEDPNTTLWWSMVGAAVTSTIFYLSWRIGLIQGGADVKALILVTIFFPSWAFVPEQAFPLVDDPIFRMPPSMVLFIWAAAAFLVAPPVIFAQNATKGNIESFSDLKMAWHATKREITELKEMSRMTDNANWILTDFIQKDGKMTVVNRILPSRNSTLFTDNSQHLETLEELGTESVWIASKHPFIVYLFLAIFPMLLLGDPLSFLIR